MKFKHNIATRTLAGVIAVSTVFAGAGPASALGSSESGSAWKLPSWSTFGDGRPWWDPTYVIETPVNPERSEGEFGPVLFTDDADCDHVIPKLERANSGKGPYYGRVQTVASGYAPGKYYTVRITLREAGTGEDWGVYTWLTYKATDEGKLFINLRLQFPSRAKEGEKIVAVPTVYNANDVRRDGRPKKQKPDCTLRCDRVPPLTAFTDYNDPNATITIGPAE